MPVDELLFATKTARRLKAVWDDTDWREPSLRFPSLRDDARNRRVSEQEARVLMCRELEGAHNYSIEYPTRELYTFSGQASLSARVDLAVLSADGAMTLAVEFKANQPPQGAIDKDMEKLVFERVPGLWFHTLRATNSKTLERLFSKLKVGLENGKQKWHTKGHTDVLDHKLTVAVVVLSGPKPGLWTQQTQIDQGIHDAWKHDGLQG